MKVRDKKAIQKLQREKHREKLRESKRKKRTKEPLLKRKNPIKQEKERILIVCEGENTEPSYFNKFKLSTARITSVGEGCNTISLAERAFEISQKNDFDQVWCVFDKDDFILGL